MPTPNPPPDPLAPLTAQARRHGHLRVLPPGDVPPLLLDLRLRTGDALALGYAHLLAAEFDAGGRLVLHAARHRVTLEGRNLRPLYDALVLLRLAAVKEVGGRDDDLSETATVVNAVRVERVA